MQPIKIVLMFGGFMGDLITCLHDITCLDFLDFRGKVWLKRGVRRLQFPQGIESMDTSEKDAYLSRYHTIPCHDTKFAFKYKNHTAMVTCTDNAMSKYCSGRFFHHNQELLDGSSATDYHRMFLSWQDFWWDKFPHKIDISNIFDDAMFFEKMSVEHTPAKKELFEKWKVINEKSYRNHTAK